MMNSSANNASRAFIRHPTGMPIRFRLEGDLPAQKERLRDVSAGGLRFCAQLALEPGYSIHLVIPFADKKFEADGVVVWCHKDGDYYDVGVRLENQDDRYGVRMVEQLCHIERYKQQILERDGRHLTSEEAAAEWISRFASEFPSMQ